MLFYCPTTTTTTSNTITTTTATVYIVYVYVISYFTETLSDAGAVAMDIAPGEPVPPGFENEVKIVAEIQSKIDKCKNMSLIGLEYLMELHLGDDKEPGYLCVLCEKRGDPRTIMDHITSYKHRLKYLVKPILFRLIFEFISNFDAVGILERRKANTFLHLFFFLWSEFCDCYALNKNSQQHMFFFFPFNFLWCLKKQIPKKNKWINKQWMW